MAAILQSDLPYLKLLFRGKVRDIYDLGDELLLVASDRLSAFDVVFPTPIPGKGEILTQISLFWFEKMKGMVKNHISPKPVEDVFKTDEDRRLYAKRSMRVIKTEPLKVESIVRGYLAGSGWAEYQKSGTVCGIPIPKGLEESAKLPEAIFTPSTKAPQGEHDENISFETAAEIVGRDVAEKVRDLSLAIYKEGLKHAETKGILLADTKFEFGLREGELILIDEVLTPDSSRFWPKAQYQTGISPPSFDKQYVRDYVTKIGWNKKPPAPVLPDEIVSQTVNRYQEALEQITR